MPKSKIFYRRHLPHFQPPDSAFHVVFRLDGSLPIEVIQEMKREREQKEKLIAGIKNNILKLEEWRAHHETYFEKFDSLMDSLKTGPRWLSEPAVAKLVSEAIKYRDGKEYNLYAYCIMSNHVHLIIFVSRPDWSTYKLTDILENLKWYCALKCNKLLNKSGAFWQHESYDHVIQNDEELYRTIDYVLNNPVKAGLVSSWEMWPWTYCNPEIQ